MTTQTHFELPRIGRVIEIDSPLEDRPEPGTYDDYMQQQYRKLQAVGLNCTDCQFAEWFIYLYGGTLCGEKGVIIDFGEVENQHVDCDVYLQWDAYLDSRYPPR